MRAMPGLDECSRDQWCHCRVCRLEREEAAAEQRPRKRVVNEAEQREPAALPETKELCR